MFQHCQPSPDNLPVSVSALSALPSHSAFLCFSIASPPFTFCLSVFQHCQPSLHILPFCVSALSALPSHSAFLCFSIASPPFTFCLSVFQYCQPSPCPAALWPQSSGGDQSREAAFVSPSGNFWCMIDLVWDRVHLHSVSAEQHGWKS